MTTEQLLAREITERVCECFRSFEGRYKPASDNIKSAIYQEILNVLETGVEI